MGLVAPSCIPQVQALGRASTSGLLTHYMWNSILEHGEISTIDRVAAACRAKDECNPTYQGCEGGTKDLALGTRSVLGKDRMLSNHLTISSHPSLSSGVLGKGPKDGAPLPPTFSHMSDANPSTSNQY